MMEKALLQSVLRVNDDTPIVWAENIFNAIQLCTNAAVAGIAAAITSGKCIRILFLKILIALSEGQTSQVQRLVKKLSTFFDWHTNPARDLLKILDRIDEELCSKLLIIFSDPADMTKAEAFNLMAQFVQLTENTDLVDIHYQFLIRSCVALNDQLMHQNLMNLVDQQLGSGSDVTRSSCFLIFWISIYDRFFEETQVQDFLVPILRRNPLCLQILLTKRSHLICLPDSFWDRCLQPDDHVSHSGSSGERSSIATEIMDGDSFRDDGSSAVDNSGSNAVIDDEVFEDAVRHMDVASVSLIGEPDLSESSSPSIKSPNDQ